MQQTSALHVTVSAATPASPHQTGGRQVTRISSKLSGEHEFYLTMNDAPQPLESSLPPAPSEPAPTTFNDWSVRVLALVPLVGIALLWSNHHLGLGAGSPALLASIAAVSPIALSVLTTLLDKDENAALDKGLRGLIARRLTWGVLGVGYLVLSIVLLTWTSVVVLAEDGGQLGRVGLQALDSAKAPSDSIAPAIKGDPARFVLASHPLGRPFKLELEGYVPKVVEVYPIVGLRIRPSVDLKRAPSVLLRFSGVAKGSWSDVGGAELRLVLVSLSGSERVVAAYKDPVGALLIGRGQPVPSLWASNWQTELVAKGVTDPKLAARDLLAWKQPKVLQLASGLEPGMHLRATLTNNQKFVLAKAEFFLGKDELQDQLMEDSE